MMEKFGGHFHYASSRALRMQQATFVSVIAIRLIVTRPSLQSLCLDFSRLNTSLHVILMAVALSTDALSPCCSISCRLVLGTRHVRREREAAILMLDYKIH